MSKTTHKGWFCSFQAVGRGAACLKRKGCFDRCGGRLKELFEKSSLRNLKNFPAVVDFHFN